MITGPRIIEGLHAEYRAGRRYELMFPFVYASAVPSVGTIVVPAQFVSNFHSVPRVLWPIFPPDDWAESSVAHDWLYFAGTVTRHQADQVHRELLLLLGAPTWRANVMYAGLRCAGWTSWRKYRQRVADASLGAHGGS